MAAIDFEDYVWTERGVAINGATVQLQRSDSGAVLTSTTTGTDYGDGLGAVPGRWKLSYDISTLPAGVYPDIVITNGSQVRKHKGQAQLFIRSLALQVQGLTLGSGNVWDLRAGRVILPGSAVFTDPLFLVNL